MGEYTLLYSPLHSDRKLWLACNRMQNCWPRLRGLSDLLRHIPTQVCYHPHDRSLESSQEQQLLLWGACWALEMQENKTESHWNKVFYKLFYTYVVVNTTFLQMDRWTTYNGKSILTFFECSREALLKFSTTLSWFFKQFPELVPRNL